MPLRDLFVQACFWVSVPFCFFRPFFGILVWYVIAFLNPQWYTWGYTGATVAWALVVAIPLLSGFLLFTKGWMPRLVSREVFLLVILWCWFAVTSIVSSNTPLFEHHADDTWYHFQFISKILLMTLVTIGIVDSLERLRVLVMVIACSFGFIVVKSLPFLVATGGVYRLYGPPHSMIADNNDVGLALNMTLPMFFFLARTESRRWLRLVFFGLMFATIPAVFCTYSRGAMVGMIAVLVMMLLQSNKRLLLAPAIVFGIVVVVFFAPASWKQRMNPTYENQLDYSAQSRINAWNYSLNLAAEYPITGGGFGTFTAPLFARYAPRAGDIHGPHSIYFQVLAEHGYVGIVLYLAVVFSALISTFVVARKFRWFPDPRIWQYAQMLRFSLVGFLTSGLFLGRAYFDYYFAIVACIVILKHVAERELAAEVDERTDDEDSEEYVGQRDGLALGEA